MTRPAPGCAALPPRAGRGPRRGPARGRAALPWPLPGTAPAGCRGRVHHAVLLAAHPSLRRPRRHPLRPRSSSCGFLDVSCEIGNAITSWFAALARDALRPLLTLAGQTLLSSPQPGAIPAVHSHVGDLAGDRRLRVRAAGAHRRGHRDGPRDPADLLFGQGDRAAAGRRVPGRQPVPGPDLPRDHDRQRPVRRAGRGRRHPGHRRLGAAGHPDRAAAGRGDLHGPARPRRRGARPGAGRGVRAAADGAGAADRRRAARPRRAMRCRRPRGRPAGGGGR